MASTETRRHIVLRDPSQAGALIAKGGLVAFPTETVYGLGADATDGLAVARIYAAKGRPAFNPLIVHVPDLAAAERLAVFDDTALLLAKAFWPGPMTLVLPLEPDHELASLVTAGLDTVAIRVPASDGAQAVLRAAGTPVAAPSANPSGRISATRADHVIAGLGDRVDAILDGGACAVGVESTILRTEPLALLREGGLAAEEIEATLGQPLPRDTTPGKVQAPGQLTSHYAPGAPLQMNVSEAQADAVLLGFGPIAGDLTLSASGDLTEAAANLFDMLHRADVLAGPRGRISVAPIPDHGLGGAINDRLRRASA